MDWKAPLVGVALMSCCSGALILQIKHLPTTHINALLNHWLNSVHKLRDHLRDVHAGGVVEGGCWGAARLPGRRGLDLHYPLLPGTDPLNVPHVPFN